MAYVFWKWRFKARAQIAIRFLPTWPRSFGCGAFFVLGSALWVCASAENAFQIATGDRLSQIREHLGATATQFHQFAGNAWGDLSVIILPVPHSAVTDVQVFANGTQPVRPIVRLPNGSQHCRGNTHQILHLFLDRRDIDPLFPGVASPDLADVFAVAAGKVAFHFKPLGLRLEWVVFWVSQKGAHGVLGSIHRVMDRRGLAALIIHYQDNKANLSHLYPIRMPQR